MIIELVGIYPMWYNKKNKFCQGTCHIYIVDMDIDLRGVRFYRKGTGEFDIKMPVTENYDMEKKVWSAFPTFNFVNEKTTEDMKKQVSRLLGSDEVKPTWNDIEASNVPVSFKYWLKLKNSARGKYLAEMSELDNKKKRKDIKKISNKIGKNKKQLSEKENVDKVEEKKVPVNVALSMGV